MKVIFPMLAAAAVAAMIAAPAVAGEAEVKVDALASSSVLKSGESQRVFVRVGLESVLTKAQRVRASLNIAIVIDRSGSMAGAKIEEAKRAAAMAVGRLSARDIVSVVSYDDRVEVEVPATRASDKQWMLDRIRRLTPRGSTAIHAGLLAGAAEVRKFKSRETVNRIVLLSDGLANVGPRTPREFVSLGQELGSEGIVVSTVGLGLGYNEDLMAGLARAADGNHSFVQEPQDLAQFFVKEFDEAQAIVGQDAVIRITVPDGVKPLRGLGREAKIEGNAILYRVGQLVGGTSQALIAEVEVGAGVALTEREIAQVAVEYQSTETSRTVALQARAKVRFSSADEEVGAGVRADVMRDVTLLEARAQTDEAIRLRDAGRYEEAQRKFQDNAAVIAKRAATYGFGADDRIQAYRGFVEGAGAAGAAPSSPAWSIQRKQLREQEGNVPGVTSRY